MNIKNVKPSKKSAYKQSYYSVQESTKYIGAYPIICRSSWERKSCIYFDKNPDIVKWASEPFAVKYYNILDKKYHTYFPDFYIKVKKGNTYIEYVVEVKPKSHLTKPKKPKNKNRKALLNYRRALNTYVTNLCKIDALKKFAKSRNYKVLLITEKSWFI